MDEARLALCRCDSVSMPFTNRCCHSMLTVLSIYRHRLHPLVACSQGISTKLEHQCSLHPYSCSLKCRWHGESKQTKCCHMTVVIHPPAAVDSCTGQLSLQINVMHAWLSILGGPLSRYQCRHERACVCLGKMWFSHCMSQALTLPISPIINNQSKHCQAHKADL